MKLWPFSYVRITVYHGIMCIEHCIGATASTSVYMLIESNENKCNSYYYWEQQQQQQQKQEEKI